MAMISLMTAGEKLYLGDLVFIDPADGKLKRSPRPWWEEPSSFFLPPFTEHDGYILISDREEIWPWKEIPPVQ